MLRKLMAALVILLSSNYVCYAHLLNSSDWCSKGDSDIFYSSKGIEYSKTKPRTATLLHGQYCSVPDSEPKYGITGIVYKAFEMKYYEGKPEIVTLCNVVDYDANGDIIFAYSDIEKFPTTTKEKSLYPFFWGKNPMNDFGKPGKETNSFFLPPIRWKCILGPDKLNKKALLYDKETLNSYLKLGDKITEAWVCIADFKDKTYTRTFVEFNHSKRLVKMYSMITNKYGSHDIIEKKNLNGIEYPIIPGTSFEALNNTLLGLRK